MAPGSGVIRAVVGALVRGNNGDAINTNSATDPLIRVSDEEQRIENNNKTAFPDFGNYLDGEAHSAGNGVDDGSQLLNIDNTNDHKCDEAEEEVDGTGQPDDGSATPDAEGIVETGDRVVGVIDNRNNAEVHVVDEEPRNVLQTLGGNGRPVASGLSQAIVAVPEVANGNNENAVPHTPNRASTGEDGNDIRVTRGGKKRIAPPTKTPKSRKKLKTVKRVLADNTSILAIKVVLLDETCYRIFVQIEHRGPFVPIEDIDIEVLEERGHLDLLEAVKRDAIASASGMATRPVRAGAKSSDVKEQLVTCTTDIQPIGSVKFSATGKHCAIFALANMLDLPDESMELMKGACDTQGRIGLNELNHLISVHPKEFQGEMNKIKPKHFHDGPILELAKHYSQHSPKERLALAVKMARAGRYLLVAYISHRGAKDHVVGMHGEYVYDSDEATGGIYRTDDFIQREMVGIDQARLFVPFTKD